MSNKILYAFFITILVLVLIIPGMAFMADSGDLSKNISKAISWKYENYTDTENPAEGEVYVEVSATDDGRVTLEGRTNTLFEKYRIHDIVTRVPGVTKISNQLAVDTKTVPNETIKNHIQQEIKHNQSIIEPDQINITVDDGLVVLSGKVNYNYEKELIRTITSWQDGVHAIENNIEVMRSREGLSDESLEEVLQEILENQFPAAEKFVTFVINDGVVIISGDVSNLWTKKNIEDEFRSVVGVVDVFNELEIPLD